MVYHTNNKCYMFLSSITIQFCVKIPLVPPLETPIWLSLVLQNPFSVVLSEWSPTWNSAFYQVVLVDTNWCKELFLGIFNEPNKIKELIYWKFLKFVLKMNIELHGIFYCYKSCLKMIITFHLFNFYNWNKVIQ